MTSVATLYVYRDTIGAVLYVGITSRGGIRASEHQRHAAWWDLAASCTFQHFQTREEALQAERDAIRHYRPPFNVVHNAGAMMERGDFLRAYDGRFQVYGMDEDMGRSLEECARIGRLAVEGGTAVSVRYNVDTKTAIITLSEPPECELALTCARSRKPGQQWKYSEWMLVPRASMPEGAKVFMTT